MPGPVVKPYSQLKPCNKINCKSSWVYLLQKHDWNDWVNNMMTWGQSYKTFYGRNWFHGIVSQCVCISLLK